MKNDSASNQYYLYARKSTDEDSGKQIHSIEDQIELVNQYASQEGLEIVDTFIESQTAKVPGRPVFDQMISKLENKNSVVSGIVSWHPDRLARNSVDGGRIIYLLDQNLITQLKFPNFWFENTPQGKFMLNLAFGQSKYYVDSLSKNVERGMRQKAKRGEFPGWAPMGYLNNKATRKIDLDPTRFKLVKQGLEDFASGKHGVHSLTAFFKSKGVVSKKTGNLVPSTVHRTLINPFYYGAFVWAGELYPGIHQPMIKKSTFDKIRLILTSRNRGGNQRNIYDFPFKSLLKCGECGRAITAETHTKHYKRTNRSATYIYYRCTKSALDYKCKQGYISQANLTGQFDRLISSCAWPSSLVKRALSTTKALEQNQLGKLLQTKRGLDSQVEELDANINQLIDLHLKGILTQEEFVLKKNQLTKQKLGLKDKLSRNPNQPTTGFEPVYKLIKNLAVAGKIADQTTNLNLKVAFTKMVASNLYLQDQKIRYSLKNVGSRPQARPTSRELVTLRQVSLNRF
jgi:site-specific DNA recombinase